MRQYRAISLCHLVGLSVFVQGCGTLNSYTPPPAQLEDQVQIPGFANIRAWGNVPSDVLKKSAIASIKQELAANHGKLETEVNVLALSGGGADGAFGAGFLNGWTKSGTRPQFKLVTGISTGSLMAPFAFLGPAYDPLLKKAYTSMSDNSIYKRNSIFSILLSLAQIRPMTAAADNTPLAQLIATMIDAKVLKKIAAEHLKGRRLLMGTSQLNAERLVIWDMGAIATRGTPEALALFRKVMLASASLPAFFPPQFFEVEAGGKKYTEMHGDGGVQTQVMLFQNALVPFSKTSKILEGHKRVRKLYIIRNLKIEPESKTVKPELQFIALRSIGTLTKTQGIGDLFRLYVYSLRDHFEYNLAYIPSNFNLKSKSPFDQDYMDKLYDRGYQMAASGYQWQHYPPLYTLEPD